MTATQPDVVIVGAGPAGMSAGVALQKAGANVRVIDEQTAAGGQIYREIERNQSQRTEVYGLLGQDYAAGSTLVAAFNAADIPISYATSVWDIEAANEQYNKVLRIGLVNAGQTEMLYPRHIILACGAMERPTPFPGWTLPGVMTVGAAQTLLKDGGLVPEGNVVVAGNGPLLTLFVKQLLSAGVQPTHILHTGKSPFIQSLSALPQAISASLAAPGILWKGLSWLQDIRRAGIPQTQGISTLAAHGADQLSEISYTINGKTKHIPADLLLVHDGVIPNSHLAMAASCQHDWHQQQRCWTPQVDEQGASSQADITIIGDAAGIQGADVAQLAGHVRGWQVAEQLGLQSANAVQKATAAEQHQLKRLRRLRDFLDLLYPPSPCFYQQLPAETLVCRCEEVTAQELREVAAHGCMGPNQAKAFTRCGMGPCMGRLCGNTVSQLLAEAHGTDVADMGHYRIRAPIKPLSVGELARMDT